MTRDVSFYHPDEGRPHDLRLVEQEARLRAVVAASAPHAPALRAALRAAERTPEELALADLPRLPLLRKDDLPVIQHGSPPFGGWLGRSDGKLRRIFVSPGPIYDPEAYDDDYWGFAPALHAAGFRPGDITLNTFSHHFTPAGAMFDGALAVLRCIAVPAGVGNLELQVRTLLELGARGFIGTPGFLAAVLARLSEMGAASPLEVAFVSGEMLSETLRGKIESQGVRVSQGYATGDVGLIAYECPARRGLHLSDRVIVEIVEPATGAPVAPGEAGEVAVTFLHELYPLVRLATGDLSRFADGTCPCGRTAPRLTRIIGRVGEAIKVRGLFLHPHDLDRAVARHREVARYRAVVTRGADQEDVLTVSIEVRPGTPRDLDARVARSIHATTRLRAVVIAVEPGEIPPGAERIEDRRVWD